MSFFPPVRSFTGRDQQLAALRTQLTDQGAGTLVPTTALTGMGGTGKTQLALAYAQRYRGDYTLGWWIPSEAELGMLTALAELGAVFGVAMPFAEGGNPGSIAGGAFIAGAGLLVLGGINARRRGSRVAGDRMIVVGALPTLPWMWLILPPLAGLTVILAAAVDAAEARSLGGRQRRRTA